MTPTYHPSSLSGNAMERMAIMRAAVARASNLTLPHRREMLNAAICDVIAELPPAQLERVLDVLASLGVDTLQ